jgi:hypothetical protein
VREGFEPSWSSIGQFVHMIQPFILLTKQMLKIFFIVYWLSGSISVVDSLFAGLLFV